MDFWYLEIMDDQNFEVELEPQTRKNLSKSDTVDPKPPRNQKMVNVNK